MAVQFTEAEWLIMSSLGYCVPKGKFDKNGYPIGNSKVYVKDLLAQLERQATGKDFQKANFKSEADRQNYLAALKSLKKKLGDGNYRVCKSVNHNSPDQSGFEAFAIVPEPNYDNDVIICCRGSDSMSTDNLNDWIGADAALAVEVNTRQQREMEAFMEGMERYDNIYLTGHSLGGNLAMYGAITFAAAEKIRGVYSFDGPGFNAAFCAKYHFRIKELEDRIYNYQNEHDLVSSSEISVGTIIITDSAITDDGQFVNHNRWAIHVDGDGHIIRNRDGKKDELCLAWNRFTVGMNFKPFMLKLLLISVTASIVRDVIKKIKEWTFKHSSGYAQANANPLIVVNTTKLRSYATKLSSLSKRAKTLDRQMNSYYWQLGIEWDATATIWNLGKFLKANVLMDFAGRLDRTARCLRETAEDFDSTEREIRNI